MPYMVTFTINIPQMWAYIPYLDPMGYVFQLANTTVHPWAIGSQHTDKKTLAQWLQGTLGARLLYDTKNIRFFGGENGDDMGWHGDLSHRNGDEMEFLWIFCMDLWRHRGLKSTEMVMKWDFCVGFMTCEGEGNFLCKEVHSPFRWMMYYLGKLLASKW